MVLTDDKLGQNEIDGLSRDFTTPDVEKGLAMRKSALESILQRKAPGQVQLAFSTVNDAVSVIEISKIVQMLKSDSRLQLYKHLNLGLFRQFEKPEVDIVFNKFVWSEVCAEAVYRVFCPDTKYGIHMDIKGFESRESLKKFKMKL